MSVLVITKVRADTTAFQKALANRASEFEAVATRARGAGAKHHRFGIGDGYVMVVDEWDSVEEFQGFFSDPELQAFIGSVGGEPGEPEIMAADAIHSPDEF
jgi:hypothetical protein